LHSIDKDASCNQGTQSTSKLTELSLLADFLDIKIHSLVHICIQKRL